MRFLDTEYKFSGDVLLMWTLLLLDNLVHNWGLPSWVSGLCIVLFAILAVRYFVLAVRDEREDKQELERSMRTLPQPQELCDASTQKGTAFIKCTFPRGHIPAGDHSWTVDL